MPKTAQSIEFDELHISVDRDADVPLGVQLAWALQARIRDGRLGPGQRLPGLRDLAEALGINANTVRSVYQRLEQQGVIESHQGSGTFVASTLKLPPAVGTIAANAAREAQETGVDPREVAAALYVASEPAELGGELGARRRQLRHQIAALEQALADIHARYPGLDTATAEAHTTRGPRLLSADDLEDIQAKLLRRLVLLQSAIDDLGKQNEAKRLKASMQEQARKEEQAAKEEVRRQVVQPRPASPKKRSKARPAPAGA